MVDQTLIQLYHTLDATGKAQMEKLYPPDTFKPKKLETVEQAILAVPSEECVFDIPLNTMNTVQAFVDMLFVEAAINDGANGRWAILVDGTGMPYSTPIFAGADSALFRLPFLFKSYDDAAHVAATFPDTLKGILQ